MGRSNKSRIEETMICEEITGLECIKERFLRVDSFHNAAAGMASAVL
jgi:hypothetical protein